MARLRNYFFAGVLVTAPLAITAWFSWELVSFVDNHENARNIRSSKAVGEPPFMLAVSVFEALSMAVASVADYSICPRLDAPATPERVWQAIQEAGNAVTSR